MTFRRVVLASLALGAGLNGAPACARKESDRSTLAASEAQPPAPSTADAPDTIAPLLAAAAAGRDGDGLPARLAAVLERDDDAVDVAGAFARAGRSSKLVVDALAAAGTAAAQSALVRIARDPALPTRLRAEAVAAFVLVKRPRATTIGTAGALINAGDPELHRAALFVAGSVARAGREREPAATTALERQVLAACARAAGAPLDDRLEALAALGNLGTPAILPQVRVATASADPRLRAAASRALRFVPDPEADRMLLASLRRDRDATVRAAAVFAAGFRSLVPLAAGLSETAEGDPADFVRGDAVRLLAQHADASERVARALRYVARKDPAPDVRRLAGDPRGAP